jgi:hypothetical protein
MTSCMGITHGVYPRRTLIKTRNWIYSDVCSQNSCFWYFNWDRISCYKLLLEHSAHIWSMKSFSWNCMSLDVRYKSNIFSSQYWNQKWSKHGLNKTCYWIDNVINSHRVSFGVLLSHFSMNQICIAVLQKHAITNHICIAIK